MKAAYNSYLPDTARNQECAADIHHAQQDNISLKQVANLTQSGPLNSLVLIVSELLLKSAKSE